MVKKEKNMMDPIDLSKVLDGYEDKWVIISKDYKKVLKFSEKFEDLIKYLDLGIVMLVPNPNYPISPYNI